MFEIILGSYEQYLLGYKFYETKLKQSFAAHSHSSSIRCLAQSGNYVASGSADDRIVVYDLKTRREHCMLTHHNGTVTCLAFNKDCTHLLSGGQDGLFAIVRVGNWQLEKIWDKAHKGSEIIDIAVHDSGKLALTLGGDSTLRTWNLVKGRQAYVINLATKCKDVKSIQSVMWAPDYKRFVLSGGLFTEIWSIATGGQLQVIEHQIKVTSVLWKDYLLLGFEDGGLGLINADDSDDEKSEIVSYKAHETRVKCLGYYNGTIVTASSSGEIKLWNKDFELLGQVTADCRLTCLEVMACDSGVKKEESGESVPVIVRRSEKKVERGVVVIEVEDEDYIGGGGKKAEVVTKKSKKDKKRNSSNNGNVVEVIEKQNKIKKKRKVT